MSGHLDAPSAEVELARERTFGGRGVIVERDIRVIDLTDLGSNRDDIDRQIWDAAADLGFFQVSGHGIPMAAIDDAFERAQAFFALPVDAKAKRSMPTGTNSGWESKTQRRPSTGVLDEKESYQITRTRMDRHDLWPTNDELTGFVDAMLDFEQANWRLAMTILSSIARSLGFSSDFFEERHDPTSAEYQSTLRFLHYFALTDADVDDQTWRAGAHTDYDCLTLLHQRPGQRGLQVCPGAAAADRDPDEPLGWTDVEPTAGIVTCNIGDMLMRWSDDRLPSTLHRVVPAADAGPRYSIAFFAQANRDVIIEGPAGTHRPITAHDFLQERIRANFAP